MMGSGEFDRLEPLPTSQSQSPRHSRRKHNFEQSTELRNRPITPQSPMTTNIHVRTLSLNVHEIICISNFKCALLKFRLFEFLSF